MRAMRFTLLSILTPLGLVLLAHSADPQPPAQNVIAFISAGNPSSISLRLDSALKPVIAYRALESSLAVAHCGNVLCTSGNVRNVGDHINVQGPTSLVLDASGNPIVAYRYGDDYRGVHELKMLFCEDPNCNQSTNFTTGSHSTSSGVGPSVVLDSLGNPIVSYAANGSLRVQHCGDPTCSSNNIDVLADTGIPFTGGLALDANGNPVIAVAFIRALGLVHCGDPNCVTGNIIRHSLSDLGQFGVKGQASLALDGAGNPVISFLSQGSLEVGDLHVIHCGDPNCTSGNVDTIVDQSAAPQTVTSMALDSHGNPVIAFTRVIDKLTVIHCGDAYCTSGNTIALPAPHGTRSSLVLDPQGRPVVAFNSGIALRVLHCGTATCQ